MCLCVGECVRMHYVFFPAARKNTVLAFFKHFFSTKDLGANVVITQSSPIKPQVFHFLVQ